MSNRGTKREMWSSLWRILAKPSLLGQTSDLALFPAQLGSAIPLIVLGPLSEKIGWRGYSFSN